MQDANLTGRYAAGRTGDGRHFLAVEIYFHSLGLIELIPIQAAKLFTFEHCPG